MRLRPGQMLLGLLAGAVCVARADEVVIDFEQAAIGKPVTTWTDQGVVFRLASAPVHSKAVGRVTFFPHIATNHKGIVNAMATEQAIPVQATFPGRVSSVTVVLWGSAGCPALLEASTRMASSSTRHPSRPCPVARRPRTPCRS